MRAALVAALAALALSACVTSGGTPGPHEAARSALLHPGSAAPRTPRGVLDSLPAALRARPAAAPAATSPPPPEPGAPLDDALTCLAHTIYWESKGEGETGMAAVAHVVLNRAAAAGYPGDICAVVTQGGPRSPCQFSWYCDGRDDTPREPGQYELAHRVAWNALQGASPDPTRGATMFHNTQVRPRWATRARRTVAIGNHIFYRLDRSKIG